MRTVKISGLETRILKKLGFSLILLLIFNYLMPNALAAAIKVETISASISGYPNAVVRLGEQGVIYVVYNGSGYQIRKFNLLTQQDTLLKAQSGHAIPFNAVSNGRLTAIDITGKLFVTDGTPAGTRLVKDFGYGTSGSIGPDFSFLSAIVVSGNMVYMIVRPDSYSSSRTLWRYDWNKNQLKSVDSVQLDAASSIFPAKVNGDESSLYLFTENADKLLVRRNQPANYDVFTSLGELSVGGAVGPISHFPTLRNSKATYLCLPTNQSVSAIPSQLLRISNDGSLDVVATGCKHMYVANDTLYFEKRTDTNRALLRTSGIIGDITLVKDLGSAQDEYSGIIHACNTEAFSYFIDESEENGTRLFKVNLMTHATESVTRRALLSDDLDCLGDVVLTSNYLPGTGHKLYYLDDGNQKTRVLSPEGSEFYYQSWYINGDAFGVLMTPNPGRTYSFVKLTKIYPELSVLNLLLN